MKLMLLRKCLIIGIVFLLISTGFISCSCGFFPIKENQNKNCLSSPGDYLRFIISNGIIRSFRIHIPIGYDGDDPVPLVFMLHGSGQDNNARSIKKYCDMDEKADEEGFIVVYPNGMFLTYGPYLDNPIVPFMELFMFITNGRMLNCWDTNGIDDVGFIDDLIDHLQAKLNINSSRIFVTGVSGGGCMSYRLGSELSDRIAAIAPIVGINGGIWFTQEPDDSIEPYICSKPENPVPVIAFNGMKDKNVPYEGGWLNSFSIGPLELWVYFLSVNESINLWVDYNNCNKTPQIEESKDGLIIKRTYSDGYDSSEVVSVTYVEGGHNLFISPKFEWTSTDLMWEFFEKHPKV